ncbi:betaine/proline/choline family ABC transporter ATP-binding protein [Salipiger sp. P9]|uniref:quaternary amine ABC transporter ATP-binding protein n=1 Tax=Salipiger pentaromativorans TaxID=2943193 RepID=UPI0021578E44|nr:betaine/proline/choline family ABC transporter ATP-binding protein [Salipiger pentaromativorans]MCR8549157.1 betaine/proline/choline family ABC transporter ATP-binding protein [Salipiger pentaromativorans]
MTDPLETAEIVVEVANVWKIFGARDAEAMAAIRAEGLGKAEVLERFDCVVGVADASFQVRRGEIFCVMGLSGSGKSTLVRHINRLLSPTAGKVVVAGRDVTALSESELLAVRNKSIAMVFQDFGLMPHRSVRDNVAMPLEIRGVSRNARWTRAQDALDLVNLSDWGDKFAHELSGGMQQRVGLARAIAADAEVLLMDEPFSALDPLIRRQLQEQFMTLAKDMGKTTVFITHDLEEAVRIGDRIAIMRDGVIVQTGTPEEIILDPADDYVADFVSGISRINLIKAHSLLRPLDSFTPGLTADAPHMPESATLRQLIEIAAETDSPIVVDDAQGRPMGAVSRHELLNGVITGTAAT